MEPSQFSREKGPYIWSSERFAEACLPTPLTGCTNSVDGDQPVAFVEEEKKGTKRKEIIKRRDGYFGNFLKNGKKLSKIPNVCEKGSDVQKLTNFSPQLQKILKHFLKGKYAKKQKLYWKKP